MIAYGALVFPLIAHSALVYWGMLSRFSQERGNTFSGLALLASQKWWFLVAKSVAPVRGMERGDTFSGLALLASQKWWFLVAKTVAPVRGMERGGHFFRACFACLSKVVVFGCKNSGTSKGYGEREISLATLEREGGTFSGLTLLASQKWWFLVAKRVAPVGGY